MSYYPLTILIIALVALPLGAAYTDSLNKQAKYACIVEVSKTINPDKAKELCK